MTVYAVLNFLCSARDGFLPSAENVPVKTLKRDAALDSLATFLFVLSVYGKL
jgi:hypothetical protein